MDIDLLSKMVKELILDNDEVTLPGVGSFVAEIVPSSFSDKGYTINPPYRRLSFRQKEAEDGNLLINLYAKSNSIDTDTATRILKEFLTEMRGILEVKKSITFPGLGRLRATKENHFFFIADEDLDIYPEGFGLEPISLKTHEETMSEVSETIATLRNILNPEPIQAEVNADAPSTIQDNADAVGEPTKGAAIAETGESTENEPDKETKPTEGVVAKTEEQTKDDIDLNNVATEEDRTAEGKASEASNVENDNVNNEPDADGTSSVEDNTHDGSNAAESPVESNTTEGSNSGSVSILNNAATEKDAVKENSVINKTDSEENRLNEPILNNAGTVKDAQKEGCATNGTDATESPIESNATEGLNSVNEPNLDNAGGKAAERGEGNGLQESVDETSPATEPAAATSKQDNGLGNDSDSNDVASAENKDKDGEDGNGSSEKIQEIQNRAEGGQIGVNGSSEELVYHTGANPGEKSATVTTAIDSSTDQAASTETAEHKEKRKGLNILKWTAIILAALAITALVTFLILAHVAPDFIDSILYTPEELEILHL